MRSKPTSSEKALALSKKWYKMVCELVKSLPPEQRSTEKYDNWKIYNPTEEEKEKYIKTLKNDKKRPT